MPSDHVTQPPSPRASLHLDVLVVGGEAEDRRVLHEGRLVHDWTESPVCAFLNAVCSVTPLSMPSTARGKIS